MYILIEIISRGHSHISMFLAGGICFVLIGLINELLPWNLALTSQMLISAVIVTVVELMVGLVVNVWLKAGVWDYSRLPYNFMGQVCLLFSNFWFLLSLPAILLDDWLRHRLLGQDKPKYKIF